VYLRVHVEEEEWEADVEVEDSELKLIVAEAVMEE